LRDKSYQCRLGGTGDRKAFEGLDCCRPSLVGGDLRTIGRPEPTSLAQCCGRRSELPHGNGSRFDRVGRRCRWTGVVE
jgi:hypothetical protein